MRKFLFSLIVLLNFQYQLGVAQDSGENCTSCNKYLYWTGELDNDFFNEGNWREAIQIPSVPIISDAPANTIFPKPGCLPGANKKGYQICLVNHNYTKDKNPPAGTINPGKNIKYNLYAAHAQLNINGAVVFNSANQGLTIHDVDINVYATFSNGVLSIDSGSTVHLYNASPLDGTASVNLMDADSWVYVHEKNPDNLLEGIHKIWVNDSPCIPDGNLRINQYYQKGSIVRIKNLMDPLTIYSEKAFQGDHAAIQEQVIVSGSAIPSNLNNRINSFVLKRGYMATFAINENGTGKSKVYIASEEDLSIDEFPVSLQGTISFVRVLPWNWVTKKGTGGYKPGVDAGWYYNWGNTQTSKPNYEYVPMAWGAGATASSILNQVILKDKTTHLLGFNESDNCDDQSGRFNNLCKPEVAVAYYENLMSTGLRLGTPAPRENGPSTWLREFTRIAKERDVRFDFVAVHWYDWGSAPQNSPNADPQQVFNRFKTYLSNVYAIYGLPIWITEFNANPNRENSVHAAFLQLALPYLEQLEYVERYAYFEPMSQYSSNEVTPSPLFDANGNITNIGNIYLNHVSTPSISQNTYTGANSLEGMNLPYTEIPSEVMSFEAECGLYKGNKWVAKDDTLASNQYYLVGNPQAAGATSLAEQVHFEFDITEQKTQRVWVRLKTNPGVNGALRIKLDDQPFEVHSGMSSSSYQWFRIPRYYNVSTGKHRLTISYVNAGTLLDQIAFINTSSSVNLVPVENNTACTLPSKNWGLVASDTIYWIEAESTQGDAWEIVRDEYASDGKYMKPVGGNTAIDVPPGMGGQLRFDFEVDQDDEYTLWGKVQALTTTSDAFWFSIDGEPFRKWDDLQNQAYQWFWNKFHFSEGTSKRNFNYFLEKGNHTLVVAYADGRSKLDRIAISSTLKDPSVDDPNVFLKDPILSFEAEEAQLIGSPNIVNCATSSNGKQVNMGLSVNNGLRFNTVATSLGGNYRLSIQYMAAVARSFKLIVNGTDLGIQFLSSSGKWCFEAGVPGVYTKQITLNTGNNIIELRPVGTESPFIDKISLLREFVSFEAENAQLLGSVTVAVCGRGSNGAVVNLGAAMSNGIAFNEVSVDEPGDFILDIHYVTKLPREARVFINGISQGVILFEPSGGWCFEGGAPKIKSLTYAFDAGINKIEIKPTGTDAPFIDKIALAKIPVTEAASARQGDSYDARQSLSERIESVRVYPNPGNTGETMTIQVNSEQEGSYEMRLIDLSGRAVYENNTGILNKRGTFVPTVRSGIYFLQINTGNKRYTEKIVIR